LALSLLLFAPMAKWVFIIGAFLLVYNQPRNAVYEKITRLAQPFPDSTEVSIGFIENGNRRYVGFIKAKGRLFLVNNRQKIFGIASITKLFTCALVADMVSHQQFSLEDEIGKFYPFKIRYDGGPPVTLKALCTHSSGLPTDVNVYPEAYLRNKVQLSFEEGKYRYSNFGFIILGDILERISKKDFSKLLDEKILDPLKMKSTGIDLGNVRPEQLVKGRSAEGKNIGVPTGFKYESVGSIKSNVTDMTKFLDYQFFRYSPLKPAFQLMQKQHFRKSTNESLGLGWHILHRGNENIYYHQGFLNGYTAEIRYASGKKRGVIVLSNLSGQGPYAGHIEKIADACLEQ
jgi:CubicO group peptidase (beta-lactamase class C family)